MFQYLLGLLNGVGPGYTDLCAALIVVVFNADELQIWKEVDGIFTTDPREGPRSPFTRLCYTRRSIRVDLLLFRSYSSIHNGTKLLEQRFQLESKMFKTPRGNGTTYPNNAVKKGEVTPLHPLKALLSSFFEKRKRGATAITTRNNIVV